ncbi:MAG: hypothetical protein M3Z27_09080 [Actinomycetota bacterium]|nr:hypothetical protein [Actinomycetota bacterium]
MDAGNRPRLQLTERDRRILAFIADHRLVLASHVQALLGVAPDAAQTRLRKLERSGYLDRRALFHLQPACYQVTSRGLGAIGSELPRPRGVDMREYVHDVGTAWLWLAAGRGAFGPVAEVLSERQLRSREGFPRQDGTGNEQGGDRAAGERYGVRLWDFGPGGRERLHYPDLLLRTPEGQRIALELELSAKSRARLDKVMSAYAAERRIDAVVYLVDRPEIGRRVRAAATRAGVSSLVHVEQFSWTPSMARLATQLSRGGARGASRASGAQL